MTLISFAMNILMIIKGVGEGYKATQRQREYVLIGSV